MNINQFDITRYNRTPHELLHFLLWTTTVAGKRSDVQTKKFNKLFEKTNPNQLFKEHGHKIKNKLKRVGLGQYSRLYKCWDYIRKYVKNQELKTIKREELLAIPGIGNKTASFFLQHSRPYAEVAVLDTHVLKFLRQRFPKWRIPKVTPSEPKEYANIECLFLGLAAQKNLSPAELDNLIWKGTQK